LEEANNMSEQSSEAPATTDATPKPSPAEGPGETVATAATAEHSALRKAWSTVQRHPLGVVAVLGAATALVEVELAVGILTGIGATALLANANGPEARQQALAKGKRVLDRARALVARNKPAVEQPAAEPQPPAAAA
jgi:hypothetical protein